MSFRAFSMRALRSSAVMGFARSRIDVSAEMLGGTGPTSASPRPRCAERWMTGSVAAAPATERNVRREIMGARLSRQQAMSAWYLAARSGASHRENRVRGDARTLDCGTFGWRRRRHQQVDGIGPAPGAQIFLRNVLASQDAWHLGDEDVVFGEGPARRVQQGDAVGNTFRHDAVTRLADDDIGRGDQVLVAQPRRQIARRLDQREAVRLLQRLEWEIDAGAAE